MLILNIHKGLVDDTLKSPPNFDQCQQLEVQVKREWLNFIEKILDDVTMIYDLNLETKEAIFKQYISLTCIDQNGNIVAVDETLKNYFHQALLAVQEVIDC